MLLLTLALQCFGFSTLEPIQLAPDPYPLTFLSAEAASAKVEAASPYATQSPNISTEQALLIAGHHDQADPIPTPGIALAEPFANAGHVHPAPPARSKPALRAPPPGKSHQTNATPVVYARFKLDSPVAPNNAASLAAEGAQTAVKFHKHHTVPLEILKILPDDVAKNPLVRGKAGAPNRWSIPEDLHKAIHKGPGGGLYNETFKQHLNELGRRPTVDDILDIRNDLVKQFGLEGYRP